MKQHKHKGITTSFRAHIVPLSGTDPTLEEFGIAPATVAEFECSRFSQGVNEGIAFPLHDKKGAVTGYALYSRTDRENYSFEPAELAGRILLNSYRALQAAGKIGSVIVVESALDCMKVHQVGFPCVVATLGARLSQAQEAILADCFDRALLILPGTDAGWEATQDAVHRVFLQMYVKAAVLPSGKRPSELSEGELRAIVTTMLR